MVVEDKTETHDRVRTLLTPMGYDVKGFTEPEPALEELEQTKETPYVLVISGYAMSEMKGDALLTKAREASPDTFRILIAEAAYIDTMVSAINTARIHSCLTHPFDDQDLVNQVEQCSLGFKAAMKMKTLKQTIQRQNRQLFQIASNYKKKQAADLAQVNAREKEIRVLESKLKSGQHSESTEKVPELDDIIDAKEIQFTAPGFGLEFQKMKSQVKTILETALFNQGMEPRALSYQDVIFRALQERQYPELVRKLIPPIRMLINQSHSAGTDLFGLNFKRYMDAHFQVSFSEDKAKAFINILRKNPDIMSVTCIKYYLHWHNISYGIAPDDKIADWLDQGLKSDDKKPPEKPQPFVVAHGLDPILPVNGEIRYHFATDFLHAGKVNEDGSINFKDRGDIPFVKANTFLASKVIAETGKPGIDVTGREIPVQEPVDRTFEAGAGAVISEDGKKIHATVDGQPHLDALGKVSVFPELKINGDLGFETGDVIFDGNVVVNGTVKSGFKVKGASLTAQEVEGAEIDLTGDLNVSMGIVDAKLVNVRGTVQAKFIHNSKIGAFGDLIVQREIVDSQIRLSGACVNTNGTIINSEISANMGIEAGNIGTDTSGASKLTVGKDEHTLNLVAGIDAQIRRNMEAGSRMTAEIADLEKEDQELHGTIANHATVQDRAQLELKSIRESMADLKASGNMAAFQKVNQAAEQLEEDARNAEEDISRGFERQDTIAGDITRNKERIARLERQNAEKEKEKKQLLEYTDTKTPKPEVKAGKTIRSGTRVLGPNTTMLIQENQSRCRVVEIARKSDESGGILFHEMQITNYPV